MEENISQHLPIEAFYEGWRLVWVEPSDDPDPVYLYDDQWNILHEWDYIPSLGEVREVCQRLLSHA